MSGNPVKISILRKTALQVNAGRLTAVVCGYVVAGGVSIRTLIDALLLDGRADIIRPQARHFRDYSRNYARLTNTIYAPLSSADNELSNPSS